MPSYPAPNKTEFTRLLLAKGEHQFEMPNPIWCPRSERFGENSRFFDDDIETRTVVYLHHNCITIARDLSSDSLHQPLVVLVHGFGADCHPSQL
jgi:hypothetical protein